MGRRCLLTIVCALALAPSAQADGIFFSACDYSHSAYDDPIVHPGHHMASHRHDFFGNTGTNSRTTARKLRRGSTNCFPQADTAAYWAPSLFKGNKVIEPSRVLIYYMNQGSGRRIRAFPAGLKMIAGDSMSKRVQSPWVVNWACESLRRRGRSSNHRDQASGRIPNCRERGVRLRVTFPSCWDGKRRDSSDHKRHMAYREWDWRRRRLTCPDSHRVAVPTLVLNVTYPIRNGYKAKLASGRVRTAHADFFNGWNQGELERLTRKCLRRSKRCIPRWWR